MCEFSVFTEVGFQGKLVRQGPLSQQVAAKRAVVRWFLSLSFGARGSSRDAMSSSVGPEPSPLAGSEEGAGSPRSPQSALSWVQDLVPSRGRGTVSPCGSGLRFVYCL